MRSTLSCLSAGSGDPALHFRHFGGQQLAAGWQAARVEKELRGLGDLADDGSHGPSVGRGRGIEMGLLGGVQQGDHFSLRGHRHAVLQ